MRTYQNILLGLLLSVVMIACGENKPDAVTPEVGAQAPAPPVVSQEPEEPTAPTTTTPKLEEGPDELPVDEGTEVTIADIRQRYAAITTALERNALRTDTITFECVEDPGGGSLMRHYDGEELVLLQLSTGGEHWWENESIYFAEGQPFFVFHETGNWRFGGPYNEEVASTIDTFREDRFYLKEGTIIRALTKTYENKSWEEDTNPDEVPNQLVPGRVGDTYERLPALPQMMAGEVGC